MTFTILCLITFSFESFAVGMLITVPYPIGLCFTSANHVRSNPKLAKLGMQTLVMIVLVIAMYSLIDYFRWQRM